MCIIDWYTMTDGWINLFLAVRYLVCNPDIAEDMLRYVRTLADRGIDVSVGDEHREERDRNCEAYHVYSKMCLELSRHYRNVLRRNRQDRSVDGIRIGYKKDGVWKKLF